jgi:hypothetical protein
MNVPRSQFAAATAADYFNNDVIVVVGGKQSMNTYIFYNIYKLFQCRQNPPQLDRNILANDENVDIRSTNVELNILAHSRNKSK